MQFSHKAMVRALLCAGAVMASQQAAARWYTVTGTAPIMDSVAQARDEAVNDAIRNAMLEAGAQVSIVSDFKGGVLQHNSMSVQSSVPVRRVLVTEEQKTSGRVTVTAKVLLDDEHQRTCAASRLRKSVVPIAFSYRDQNAYQGSAGIESLNQEVGSAVYEALAKSPALAVRAPVNASLGGTGYGNAPGGELRDELVGLGRQNQAGFIVTGTIDSAAASDAGSGVLDKLFYQRTRTISFSVTVYDARNGSQLFTQNYQAVTDWPFKQGEF
ncbi:MAG: flagellar assembly protein T N-terminal domain-containing protein, partial [Succinivibrio sp.]